MSTTRQRAAETLARKFHETYERLAPDFDYRTRTASAVPWGDVPAQNRQLMIATCRALLDELDEPELDALLGPPR